MDREYFSFELSTRIDLALSLTDMKVVTQFEVKNICIVPGVADFWYGVTNFKGSLIWVLDSDRFLNGALRRGCLVGKPDKLECPVQRPEGTLHPKGAVSLMGETTGHINDMRQTESPLWGDPRRQPLPKTAQHRAFNIAKTASSPQKLTSVILHQQQAQKKVAIVTRQLKGIISIQSDRLKPIENDPSMLSKCCSAVVETEVSTYIIEPAALLHQLQKRSLNPLQPITDTPSDIAHGTKAKHRI